MLWRPSCWVVPLCRLDVFVWELMITLNCRCFAPLTLASQVMMVEISGLIDLFGWRECSLKPVMQRHCDAEKLWKLVLVGASSKHSRMVSLLALGCSILGFGSRQDKA